MTENQQERRRDVRVTFRATVRLRFPDGREFAKCETADISVSGVFVKGVAGVAVGERCEVEFNLLGRSSSLLLEMAGEVVRVMNDGLALQFYEVDQDSFCHLQNIVFFNYKEAGGPDAAFAASATEVADETLYLGLDEPRRAKPLPDDYLGNGHVDGDDYGDDLDRDIVSRTGYDPSQDE